MTARLDQEEELFQSVFDQVERNQVAQYSAATSSTTVVAERQRAETSDFTSMWAASGHTLRPNQLGVRVAVVGDGWGGGSGGYEATVLEADAHTFTVVALGGPSQWSETHVLRRCCISLDGQPAHRNADGSPGAQQRHSASPSVDAAPRSQGNHQTRQRKSDQINLKRQQTNHATQHKRLRHTK